MFWLVVLDWCTRDVTHQAGDEDGVAVVALARHAAQLHQPRHAADAHHQRRAADVTAETRQRDGRLLLHVLARRQLGVGGGIWRLLVQQLHQQLDAVTRRDVADAGRHRRHVR